MNDTRMRQLLTLLLAENGVVVPGGADAAECMRRYFAATPLPEAAENALAEIFDAAASSSGDPPSKQE